MSPPRQPRDSAMLEQAHQAAHAMSKRWVRSVFREVCYQLWKDNWKVEYVDPNENDDETENESNSLKKKHDETKDDNDNVTPPPTHCRLHLTEDMIQQAQATCQRVADRWSFHLKKVGHVEFANWVQEVVQLEGPTCFYVEDEEEEQHELHGKQSDHDTTHLEQESVNPTESQVNTDKNEIGGLETDKNKETSTAMENGAIETDTTESPTVPGCALTALRQLHVDYDSEGTSLEDQQKRLIRKLDDMGRAGKTDWPFDWHIVEQIAQQTPQRLYSCGNNSSTGAADYQIQLVPKSELPTNDSSSANNNDNQKHHQGYLKASDAHAGWTEEMVVHYKRKKRLMPESDNHANSNSTSPNKRRKPSAKDEEPRPACPDDQITIPWNKTVSQEMAKQDLDVYLHPDPATTETIPHTVLGALKTLGHVHFAKQLPIDDENIDNLSDKQRKRKFWSYFRERLGPHQLELNVKPQEHVNKARTKVLTSTSKNDDQEEHWWNFDLGECTLELQDETDDNDSSNVSDENLPSKRLYAFSSLEVFLLDEGDDVDLP